MVDYLVDRDKLRSKAIKQLPEAYTLVTPCDFPKENPPPPPVTSAMICQASIISMSMATHIFIAIFMLLCSAQRKATPLLATPDQSYIDPSDHYIGL